MDYAFEYVEKDGLCTESDYGYVGTKKESCKASTCTRVGFSVKSYTDIKKGAEDDLETAVANIGPISIAVDANSKWQMYSGGVMKAPIFKKDSLDHGVLAVGYDNEGDKGVAYWIIKNSWNENWGEKGYLRLEKGKNAYGLSDSASYPVLG